VQGDQIGQIFDILAIVYFGLFLTGKKFLLFTSFDKQGDGSHFYVFDSSGHTGFMFLATLYPKIRFLELSVGWKFE
jgi:hypothetical protein